MKDNDFSSNIIVDPETINKMNITSRLLGKRAFYLEHYKDSFFEHLKNEYNELHSEFPNVEIIPEARIKSQKSFNEKIKSVTNGDSTDIYDIFGNRYIIVSVNGSKAEKDIIPVLYKIRDTLAYSNPEKVVIPSRIKDYVKNPKHSTYQSLHITRLHSLPGTNRFSFWNSA